MMPPCPGKLDCWCGHVRVMMAFDVSTGVEEHNDGLV